MNAAELIAFEASIAEAFNRGEIRAPVHLDGGNENQLIDIFGRIKREDWVFCSWRSHYKALLHGVPPAKVKAEIMAGRSMTLCWAEHRFFSSAIVGGILPIALGVAWQIKRQGGIERVWAFSGDMTARTGLMHECMAYTDGFQLPVSWVLEDNDVSVLTDTKLVWGHGVPQPKYAYHYKPTYPHAGAGRRINF